MKKALWNIMAIFLTLMLFAPTYAFADMGSLAGQAVGYGIFIIIFLIIMFLVFREVLCWYWKINTMVSLSTEMVNHQGTIIALLEEIRDKSSLSTISGSISTSPSPSTKQTTVCPKCSKVYEGNMSGQYCSECGSLLS